MEFLKALLEGLVGLAFKKDVEIQIPIDGPAPTPVQEEAPKAGNVPVTAIDWTNKDYAITPHFTVGDAITLHAWNRLATEADGLTDDIKQKLVTLCNKMEEVREFLGFPISVHCMFRSQKYNAEVVKAIPNDVHAQGLAIDLDCGSHMTIDELHAKLEPELERFGIRMERNTPTWCHLDLHPVVNSRYFNA